MEENYSPVLAPFGHTRVEKEQMLRRVLTSQGKGVAIAQRSYSLSRYSITLGEDGGRSQSSYSQQIMQSATEDSVVGYEPSPNQPVKDAVPYAPALKEAGTSFIQAQSHDSDDEGAKAAREAAKSTAKIADFFDKESKAKV